MRMSIMENTRSFSLIYKFTKDNNWFDFNKVKFVYIAERDIQFLRQGSTGRWILLLQVIHHDLPLAPPLFIFSFFTIFLEISFITVAIVFYLKRTDSQIFFLNSRSIFPSSWKTFLPGCLANPENNIFVLFVFFF